MKIAEEKIRQIIELHSAGLIDKEIGSKIGLCSDAIYYHRKKLGLPANGPTKGSLIIDELGRRKCSKCSEFYDPVFFSKDKEGSVRRCCEFCRKEYKKQNYRSTKFSLEKAISYRFRYWKKRAKEEGIPFEIDYDYVMSILAKQNFKCFYSDLEMLLDGTREDHGYSLSIDKIIPTLGYVKGNIVFCIHKINLVKNNLTLEEIQKWMPEWYSRIEGFLGKKGF